MGRAETEFREHGAKQVAALAQGFELPIEIVIRRKAHLESYDFKRQGFPIGLANDGLDRVSGFSAKDQFGQDTGRGVLSRYNSECVLKGASVFVQWRNSAGPTIWMVSNSDAPSVVAQHPAQPGGRRPVYVGTTATIHSLSYNDRGRPVFDGELLSVSLYWDQDLTKEFAVLPLRPRQLQEPPQAFLSPHPHVPGSSWASSEMCTAPQLTATLADRWFLDSSPT